MSQRRGISRIDRRIARRIEAQVETRSRWMRLGPQEYRKLVIATRRPVADAFGIGPHPHPANRRQDRIVKPSGSNKVARPDRQMPQNQPSRTSTTPSSAFTAPASSGVNR